MDPEELKKLLEESNRALEAMRKENEELTAKHDAVLQEKVDRIKADFAASEQKMSDEISKREAEAKDMAARIDELETRAARPGASEAAKEAELEKEVKNFNDWACGRISDNEYKTMVTNDGPNGGFLVPTTTRAGIKDRLWRSSPIRALATVERATIYEFLIERGEIATAGTTETGTRSVTGNPEIHKVTIDTHERYAMPKVSNRMLSQSGGFDVAGWLSRKAGQKFGRDEASDFVTGDGVSKPRGFLSYSVATTADDTRADQTLQYRATGVSGDFAADPNGADVFVRTFYDMQEEYQLNSTWLMKNTTAAEVALLKDSNGDFLMRETVVNEGLVVRTIQTRPVRLADHMPAMAANSLSVALGDFSAYVVVDPEQISTIIDNVTVKPFTLFHMTNLVGGGLEDWDAVKLIKFGTS